MLKNAVPILITFAAVTASCNTNPAPATQAVKQSSKQANTKTHNVTAVKPIKAKLPSIEGVYKSVALAGESEPCNITLTIEKVSNKYVYKLSLPGKLKTGAVTIEKSDDLSYILTLEGIEWASYEGNISEEDDENEAKEMELPVGISMELIENELMFQNYGNSMNSFHVLQECSQKYVRLVKQ